MGPIKTLVGLKYDVPTLNGIISNGVGTMYGHAGEMGPTEITAISGMILKVEEIQKQKFVPSPPKEEPWFFTAKSTSKPGYNTKFLTPEGYPAIKPPWCELVAVNINTGDELFRTQIGGYKELVEKGIHTGSEIFGAAAVTAGGVVFVSGGSECSLLALDKVTGELLWEAPLPYAAVSTPSVYEVNGKQYVVISCGGGGKQATKSGDEYIAFALPD